MFSGKPIDDQLKRTRRAKEKKLIGVTFPLLRSVWNSRTHFKILTADTHLRPAFCYGKVRKYW